jgi:hypothetical protein
MRTELKNYLLPARLCINKADGEIKAVIKNNNRRPKFVATQVCKWKFDE